mgnify:FL=1
MDPADITFVEVVVADSAVEESEVWKVTETVSLVVPVDVDTELLVALVDAICRR